MKITVPQIKGQKGGKKITMITAYDTPSAIIAGKAAADIILVGDSLTTTVLGFENTIQATLDIMIHHTAAVARAKPDSLIVGDMPWLSYHVSIKDTLKNAGLMIREGKAEAIKIEGGTKRVPVIEALVDAEIPVMGHIGLTPQSIHNMGGYKVQGKKNDAALKLIEEAKALEQAGVFAIVLEGIPDIVAKEITKAVTIPTIGIGAGKNCDGQVLVFHDALGLNFGHVPKFVRQYANLGENAVTALKTFFEDIESGTFPSDEESYHMNKDSQKELSQSLKKQRKRA